MRYCSAPLLDDDAYTLDMNDDLLEPDMTALSVDWWVDAGDRAEVLTN